MGILSTIHYESQRGKNFQQRRYIRSQIFGNEVQVVRYVHYGRKSGSKGWKKRHVRARGRRSEIDDGIRFAAVILAGRENCHKFLTAAKKDFPRLTNEHSMDATPYAKPTLALAIYSAPLFTVDPASRKLYFYFGVLVFSQ